KLRFEVTEETLTAVVGSKALAKHVDVDAFADALKPLVGRSWPTRHEAVVAVHEAASAAGLGWASKAPLPAAPRGVLGVRDPQGEVQMKGGEPEPDPELRDYENVPLEEDVEEYLRREVLPHVPDAWIDHTKTKVGYEIPFTRHFYVYKPPRPLAEIDME